jgi:hypothetical protein
MTFMRLKALFPGLGQAGTLPGGSANRQRAVDNATRSSGRPLAFKLARARGGGLVAAVSAA